STGNRPRRGRPMLDLIALQHAAARAVALAVLRAVRQRTRRAPLQRRRRSALSERGNALRRGGAEAPPSGGAWPWSYGCRPAASATATTISAAPPRVCRLRCSPSHSVSKTAALTVLVAAARLACVAGAKPRPWCRRYWPPTDVRMTPRRVAASA